MRLEAARCFSHGMLLCRCAQFCAHLAVPSHLGQRFLTGARTAPISRWSCGQRRGLVSTDRSQILPTLPDVLAGRPTVDQGPFSVAASESLAALGALNLIGVYPPKIAGGNGVTALFADRV